MNYELWEAILSDMLRRASPVGLATWEGYCGA